MPKLQYVAICDVCGFSHEASSKEIAFKLAESCEAMPTPEKRYSTGDIVKRGRFIYEVIRVYCVRQVAGEKPRHAVHCEIELLGVSNTQGYLKGAKLFGGRKKINQNHLKLVAKKGETINIKIYKYRR